MGVNSINSNQLQEAYEHAKGFTSKALKVVEEGLHQVAEAVDSEVTKHLESLLHAASSHITNLINGRNWTCEQGTTEMEFEAEELWSKCGEPSQSAYSSKDKRKIFWSVEQRGNKKSCSCKVNEAPTLVVKPNTTAKKVSTFVCKPKSTKMEFEPKSKWSVCGTPNQSAYFGDKSKIFWSVEQGGDTKSCTCEEGPAKTSP